MLRTTLHYAVNYALFYIGWVICIQQAAVGNLFTGPLVVAAMFGYHLIVNPNRALELAVVGSIMLFCTALDTLYLNLGMLKYETLYRLINWVAPPWVSAIWVLYGMCLNHSLSWLRRSYVLSAFLGAIVTPLCYIAGIKVGVISYGWQEHYVWATLAIVWFFYLPFSLWWSEWLKGRYP